MPEKSETSLWNSKQHLLSISQCHILSHSGLILAIEGFKGLLTTPPPHLQGILLFSAFRSRVLRFPKLNMSCLHLLNQYEGPPWDGGYRNENNFKDTLCYLLEVGGPEKEALVY